MPITFDEISEIHPQLFHMAELGSWSSILKHGLLSTSGLLDLIGATGIERYQIESERRPTVVRVNMGKGEEVAIRDQRPMSDRKLAFSLRDGLTPTDWYKSLNRKVFFWLTEERLETLMRAYKDKPHLVLEVDTAELLKRYGNRVLLTPMNTGSTRPFAYPRGKRTFLSPSEYPFDENRKKKGSRRRAIVELAVEYGLPDIAEFTNRATHRELTDTGLRVIEVLHERSRTSPQILQEKSPASFVYSESRMLRMGIAESLALLQTVMQAIDLYHKLAPKYEIIQTLNLPRDPAPFRQAAAQIEAQRPATIPADVYAELFAKAAKNAQACVTKFMGAMDDNLLPQDREKLGGAAAHCVCREIKLIKDFMAGVIPEELLSYWKAQGCATLGY